MSVIAELVGDSREAEGGAAVAGDANPTASPKTETTDRNLVFDATRIRENWLLSSFMSHPFCPDYAARRPGCKPK